MTVEETISAPQGDALGNTEVVSTPSAPEPSEDDALGKIYDAAMKDHPSDEVEPAPEGDQEGALKRDPATGRFASAKPEEGAQEAPEGEGEGEQASLEGEDAGAEPGSTAAEAPAHLPRAIKDAWKDIPEGARAAMAQLTAENDRKFSEMGRQLSQVKPVADRLQNILTEPAFQGKTLEQVAKGAAELAAIQATLDRGSAAERVTMVMEIAQTYGVLPMLAQQLTGQQGDQNIQTLHQEIADLKRQLGEGKQNEITPEFIQEQVSTTIKQRDTEAAIDAFASNKSEHPFFDDVAEDMPFYVSIAREKSPGADITSVLKAAYDMAINADPVVRQKVRELEANATTTTTDTKREEAAKKAASINVKSSPGGKPRQVSEEDAMGAAYDRMMAG